MRTGLNAPRSRSGCQECRRRRKKCDQAKPTCSLCQRAGKECNYERELSWGGRPFGKSIFGQYSGSLTALKGEGNSKDFVYAPATNSAAKVNDSILPSLPSQSTEDGSSSRSQDEDSQETIDSDAERTQTSMQVIQYNATQVFAEANTSMPWELSPTPDQSFSSSLSTPWKGLLDHFLKVTTISISLHASVREIYTSTLVPIALQRPGLLASILQIAGHNKRALGMEQNEEDLQKLKAYSVTSLRKMLASRSSDPESEDLALATILCLCVGDIVAGGERPQTWRTHLRGAAAMVQSSTDPRYKPGYPKEGLTELHLFLRRWYLSIEATTLLGSSNPEGLPPGFETALRLSYDLGPRYIDEYLGFPPYLVRIFGDIMRLSKEACEARMSTQHESDPEVILSMENAAADRSRQAYALLTELDQKIRPTVQETICPELLLILSDKDKRELLVLNETFHHAAAIHTHRRVLHTQSRSFLVQHRVKTIIHLVSTVEFTRDACPAVAFLLPLFSAGCEAVEHQDQIIIASVLQKMVSMYGMGDVTSTLRFLREIWRRRDTGRDRDIEWEQLNDELGIDLLCW